MKLEPGERSVLSFFPANGQAETCAQKLKGLGVSCQVDTIGANAHDGEMDYNRPGQGAVSAVNAVYYGYDRIGDDRVRVLLGADPAVSGMAGTDGPKGDRSVMLAAVCSEQQLPQVLAEIEQAGGQH